MIDTHAHLTGEGLAPHAFNLVQRAKENGVTTCINICTDRKSLELGLELMQKERAVFNAAAVQPHDVETEGEDFFPLVREAALTGKLVAIGETGLDYHYEYSKPAIQRAFLSRHFALARETNLPLIFHCREAFPDLFAMSASEYSEGKALLHCFTGSVAEAKEALDRGWLISFSGIVTFKKSQALREVAKFVPLSHMVIETDAPFLAPQSKRGEVNEPANVVEVAEVLAALKGVSREEFASVASANSRRFFGLSGT